MCSENKLVALVYISDTRLIIVAWRLLRGAASGKGKEVAVRRSLIEQALEVAGQQYRLVRSIGGFDLAPNLWKRGSLG